MIVEGSLGQDLSLLRRVLTKRGFTKTAMQASTSKDSIRYMFIVYF